jgi:tetratricopeptide (TPR) repeat protein
MPRVTRRTLKLPATLLCLLASSLSCAAQSQPSQAQPQKPEQGQRSEQGKTLEQLRQDYAVGFLDPAPHMALAKYFRDHGNRLQAFYILEAARRTRFEQEEFNAAFKTYFLGEEPFDNSKEAEAKLLAQLSRDPASHDTLFKLADIYISRDDWPKAKEYLGKLIALHPENFEDTKALAEVYQREGNEARAQKILHEWARKYPETSDAYRIRIADVPEQEADKAKALIGEALKKFPQEADFPFYLAGIYLREHRTKEAEPLYVKAAELAPDSAYVQAWVGRFFFKAEEDASRALEYYLSAYLLDPDAYETEYVESRIPGIAGHLAAPRLQELLKQGVPLAQIAEDPDPALAHLALDEMEKNWRPDYLKALVEIMTHDDGGVRWRATELLKSKVDRSFDETLRALLQDKDLRRRGLAAYLAVHLWKQASFDLMRKMLQEDAQLLRFDAASALTLEGGPEGRQIAFEHRLREPHPRLKKLLETATQQRDQPQ